MAVNISFDEMVNLKIIFELNYNTKPITKTGDYYIAKMILEGDRIGENIKHRIAVSDLMGNSNSNEFSPKNIYDAWVNINGQIIANKLKELYQNAINIDITI